MKLTVTIIFLTFFISFCRNKTRQIDDLKTGISFSGIFIKEEKVKDGQTKLYLKNEKGETIEFISMPFFGKTEEGYLRNDGKPNVNIIYDEFNNPVSKRKGNIIKMITPVYETKK